MLLLHHKGRKSSTERVNPLVYLADGTPFLPNGAVERSEVVRWLIYEQTNVIPAFAGLRFRLQTGRLAPAVVLHMVYNAIVLS